MERQDLKAKKVLATLAPDLSSGSIYNSLIQIRSKYVKDEAFCSILVKNGLVHKLVALLQRPNSKIVDICLSILGNLTLSELPRRQIRERGSLGIRTLVGILSTLSEESILSRATRSVANAAQDRKNADLFHNEGIGQLLVKILSEVESPKTKQVIVRAIRILGHTEDHKRQLAKARAVASISSFLCCPDEGLKRAVVKCLAHFTHSNDRVEVSVQIQGDDGKGISHLVNLIGHPNGEIWEGAMACVINLAHLDAMRPALGNAGAVSALVGKMYEKPVNGDKDVAHAVTALCLFARESVNRMKLRECRGLELFVSLLNNKDLSHLHDRVINSILQFSYDAAGLKVFQDEGLVPCLVQFIEEFTLNNHYHHVCEQHDGDATANPDADGRSNEEKKEEHDTASRNPEDTGDDVSVSENAEETGDDALEEDEEDAEGQADPSPSSPKAEATPREQRQFRVNSPSYRAIQDEFERMKRIQGLFWSNESPSGSSFCQSPDRSPFRWPSSGYSPCHSSPSASSFGSPDHSPGRSECSFTSSPASSTCSTSPLFNNSPKYTYTYSPSNSEPDEKGEETFSPVISFSDDEEDNSEPVTDSSPPSRLPMAKRLKRSDSQLSRIIVSTSDEGVAGPSSSSYTSSKNAVAGISSAKQTIGNPKVKDTARIGWILQILSRLSQAEKPHDHMCHLSTLKALIRYLLHTPKPNLRAWRILLRLSKNIYCVMTMINQRHISWMVRVMDQELSRSGQCSSCKQHHALKNDIMTSVGSLAETGYAEGQVCHILATGPLDEKQCVSVSIPLLVRGRKLLRNILVAHEGLDILLEVLETQVSDEELFSDAVLGISHLSGHLGIIAHSLTFNESDQEECVFVQRQSQDDLTFIVDTGEQLKVNKDLISKASPVFEAMLGGSFVESGQNTVKISKTSAKALELLVHYLYGCRFCPAFEELPVGALMELASLADKYLLDEFNKRIGHEIVRRCLKEDQVVEIYEKSLQREHTVFGCPEPLSICAISYIIVGNMNHQKRVRLFKEMVLSRMKSDFVDDINNMLSQRLKENMKV